MLGIWSGISNGVTSLLSRASAFVFGGGDEAGGTLQIGSFNPWLSWSHHVFLWRELYDVNCCSGSISPSRF